MSNNFRILHLVLFNHDPIYDTMYKITTKYYKKLNNVDTYYYTFSNSILDDYELKDDILYIKGIESYIPGILDKTIKTIKYFITDLEKDKYDYVVRSNISTIIDFKKLFLELAKVKIDYGGCLIGLKRKLFQPASNPLFIRHMPFVSGMTIIFSKNTILDLYNHSELLKYYYIDDVAIGLYFYMHRPDIKIVTIPGFDKRAKPELSHIFYRNKNPYNRQKDILKMQRIVSFIK